MVHKNKKARNSKKYKLRYGGRGAAHEDLGGEAKAFYVADNQRQRKAGSSAT